MSYVVRPSSNASDASTSALICWPDSASPNGVSQPAYSKPASCSVGPPLAWITPSSVIFMLTCSSPIAPICSSLSLRPLCPSGLLRPPLLFYERLAQDPTPCRKIAREGPVSRKGSLTHMSARVVTRGACHLADNARPRQREPLTRVSAGHP